jgi:hypothetical protein
MEEERFNAALSAKVDVCVRLAQVFGEEPLDFVMFFSSTQSFSKCPVKAIMLRDVPLRMPSLLDSQESGMCS